MLKLSNLNGYEKDMKLDKDHYTILYKRNNSFRGRNELNDSVFFFQKNVVHKYFCDYINDYDSYIKLEKYGLCKKNGEVVFHCELEDVGLIVNERFWAKLKGKWGVMDTEGRWTTKPCYEGVKPVLSMLVMAGDDGKYGAIGFDGELILDFKYSDIIEERALVGDKEKEGSWLAIAFLKGKEKVYDEPDNQEFLISNLSLNFCGPYTTAVGTSTINYYMECALYEASDCFIVTNPEGKYGVWNIINGTEVISCEYDEYRILDYLECGSTEDHRYLAIGVCQDGLWGFVRSDGRICCPPQFDDINDHMEYHHHFLIGVKKHGKWGFYNVYGAEKIPCKYDGIWAFEGDKCKVGEKTSGTMLWHYIDTHGNYLKEYPISYY